MQDRLFLRLDLSFGQLRLPGYTNMGIFWENFFPTFLNVSRVLDSRKTAGGVVVPPEANLTDGGTHRHGDVCPAKQ